MKRRNFLKGSLLAAATPTIAAVSPQAFAQTEPRTAPQWIDASDPRHQTLQKGFNQRWPADPSMGAKNIVICKSWQEVQHAANEALALGMRITVRSGGHCYEGFVSNRDGQDLAIIDLSTMNSMDYSATGGVTSEFAPGVGFYSLRVGSGGQNWNGYQALYKQAGKTLPGGSCYSVGLGGHITGGGYGLLSRQHGLVVDWLTAIDILVPNFSGTAVLPRHIGVHSTGEDAELFAACRGGGGGNFGIIINYYFATLPDAPSRAYWLTLSYPWEQLAAAGGAQGAFTQLLQTYALWWQANDRHWNDPAQGNGGLFSLLKINARAAGDIVLAVQFTDKDGRIGQGKDQPFNDFIAAMTSFGVEPFQGNNYLVPGIFPSPTPLIRYRGSNIASANAQQMDWLTLTQTINGSGPNQRGKYKSEYRIGGYSPAEIDVLWQRFYVEGNEPRLNQTLLQIDSYGGAINARPDGGGTVVGQRQSTLKSQFQTYWTDAQDDDFHIDWLRETYRQLYQAAGVGDKPYPDQSRFQGCYINYPDVDMLYANSESGAIDPRWLELYYGDHADALISLKRRIDPKNVFRHAMSIPMTRPG